MHSVTADVGAAELAASGDVAKPSQTYKTVSEYLSEANPQTVDLFEAVRAFLMGFGDDVQMKTLKFYFAFKRIKNFACVEVRKQTGKVQIYVKVDPDTVELEEGFTRDVRNVGHFGTGDLEISLATNGDLERAKPLLERNRSPCCNVPVVWEVVSLPHRTIIEIIWHRLFPLGPSS